MKHELGPLSEPFMELHKELAPHVYAAWADQMHAYATQELAAAVAPLEAEIQRLREALRGMLALDAEHHQRGGDDEDVCAEVQAARSAIDAAMERT